MVIDLCKVDRTTDENEFTLVAMHAAYKKHWETAFKKLGFCFLGMYGGGVETLYVKQGFLSELQILKEWAEAHKNSGDSHYNHEISHMLKSINQQIEIIGSTDMEKFYFSLG